MLLAMHWLSLTAELSTQSLHALIQASDVAPENKLRLTLIYALRYQKYSANAISSTMDMLLNNGVSESDVAVRTERSCLNSTALTILHSSSSTSCSTMLEPINGKTICSRTRTSSIAAGVP